MNKAVVMVMVVALLGLVVVGGCSCGKLKGVKGNVAGRVQTEGGQGRGYISVALINLETGQEDDRVTAEDSGSFMFREVEGGKYTIKCYSMSNDEIPSECKDINLGPGRTTTVNVYVK